MKFNWRLAKPYGRFIVINVLILISLTGCGHRWAKFSWEAGNCSVLFPAIPQAGNTSVKTPYGDIQFNSFRAEIDQQNVYSVAYTDYPDGIDLNIKQIFENMPNRFLQQGFHIESRTEMKFGDYPAIDFVVSKENMKVADRMFFVNRRLYQLELSFPADNPHTKERETFFNSFLLLKK